MATTKTKNATAKSVKPIATTSTAPRTVAKSTAQASRKPVVKKSVPITKIAVKPLAEQKSETPARLKKPKLVRDSFTIPKAEYKVLDDLKQRAGNLANPIKKSELLRAGIKALAALSDPAFLVALKAVPAIQAGRPTKNKGG